MVVVGQLALDDSHGRRRLDSIFNACAVHQAKYQVEASASNVNV